ncbi:MAG: BACON domain-containing protein [Odoribacteraceae bacterium]|nr:BACON domain-containing protein [Odoribacteraceae bacterium]
MDFAGESAGVYTYLPLLRNHKYTVQIKEVNGAGYPSAAEAYAHKPSNIVASVLAWDEGELNDIVFNEHYYIATDQHTLTFYSGGGTLALLAATNGASGIDGVTGWTIGEKSPWVTLSPTAAPFNSNPMPITVTVGAGGPREGYFYIVAGNLKKRITVIQSDEEEFSLTLSREELVFFMNPVNPRKVGVISVPSPLARTFAYPGGNLTWASGYNPVAWTGASLDEYSFLVDPILAGSGVRGGSVIVSVTHDGQERAKVINIKQYDRDPILEVLTRDAYPPLEGDYTLTVRSEAPWQLQEILSNPSAMLALPDDKIHAANPVTPYTYTFHLEAFPAVDYNDSRVAIARITADELDLPASAREIPVRQGGAPYLIVTDPAGKTHEFTTSTPRPVTFKTNAGWLFTTDAAFADVIAGATHGGLPVAASEAKTGSTSPVAEVEEEVTFTPHPVSLTSPAGLLTTTVTFTTVNPDGAPEDSDAVTFSRFIPENWEFVSVIPATSSVSPAIHPAATTARVNARTNINWYAQRLGTSLWPKEYTATTIVAHGDDYVDVPLSERPLNALSSWNADTTVVFRAGHDASPGILAHSVESAALPRPKYAISVTAPDVYLNYAYLSVVTTAREYSIVLVNSSNVEVGSTGGMTSGASKTVTITENTGAARTITIKNAITGDILGTFTQEQKPYMVFAGPWIGQINSINVNLCPAGYQFIDLGWGSVGGYAFITASGIRYMSGTYEIYRGTTPWGVDQWGNERWDQLVAHATVQAGVLTGNTSGSSVSNNGNFSTTAYIPCIKN